MSVYIVVVARPQPQGRAALVAAIERAAAAFHTEERLRLGDPAVRP